MTQLRECISAKQWTFVPCISLLTSNATPRTASLVVDIMENVGRESAELSETVVVSYHRHRGKAKDQVAAMRKPLAVREYNLFYKLFYLWVIYLFMSETVS